MDAVREQKAMDAAASCAWAEGASWPGEDIGAREMLDHLAQGVVVTDRQSRPLMVNRVAREIVAEADGLRLDGRGLSAARRREGAMLRWMIAAVGTSQSADAGTRTMIVSRPSMRRPLILLIAPGGPARTALAPRSGRAIVFISDPERAASVPTTFLQHAYDLTPMEAAVAIEIARGDGLQCVAEKLGISLSTVRTHLQHVFEKTGTRRQAQLAWLIAGSCGGLRMGSARGGDARP